MSYIPDCRNDENYNEKYLTGGDKDFIAGYDTACENMVNLLYNLDTYQSEFDIDGVDINLVRFLENHPKAAEVLEEVFNDWAEMQRNEIITSFIDNMAAENFKKTNEVSDKNKSK